MVEEGCRVETLGARNLGGEIQAHDVDLGADASRLPRAPEDPRKPVRGAGLATGIAHASQHCGDCVAGDPRRMRDDVCTSQGADMRLDLSFDPRGRETCVRVGGFDIRSILCSYSLRSGPSVECGPAKQGTITKAQRALPGWNWYARATLRTLSCGKEGEPAIDTGDTEGCKKKCRAMIRPASTLRCMISSLTHRNCSTG